MPYSQRAHLMLWFIYISKSKNHISSNLLCIIHTITMMMGIGDLLLILTQWKCHFQSNLTLSGVFLWYYRMDWPDRLAHFFLLFKEMVQDNNWVMTLTVTACHIMHMWRIQDAACTYDSCWGKWMHWLQVINLFSRTAHKMPLMAHAIKFRSTLLKAAIRISWCGDCTMLRLYGNSSLDTRRNTFVLLYIACSVIMLAV